VDSIKMRGIDVFYQLRYFLSLNAMNAYIQGRRGYCVSRVKASCDYCDVVVCACVCGGQS
jgi:hypothetical protein